MKQRLILMAFVVGFGLTSFAQENVFKQDFENVENDADVTKLQKNKFTVWGNAKFTVTEKKGKGNKGSNKYTSSTGTESASLVVYRNLEVGVTYVFSVAVKMTNVDGNANKANYAVNATSGKRKIYTGMAKKK